MKQKNVDSRWSKYIDIKFGEEQIVLKLPKGLSVLKKHICVCSVLSNAYQDSMLGGSNTIKQ